MLVEAPIWKGRTAHGPDPEPMSDDSRSSPASTSAAPAAQPGQSWIERILDRVGLRQQSSSREDIADALEETSRGPTDLSMHERAMLRNVLALSQTRSSM